MSILKAVAIDRNRHERAAHRRMLKGYGAPVPYAEKNGVVVPLRKDIRRSILAAAWAAVEMAEATGDPDIIAAAREGMIRAREDVRRQLKKLHALNAESKRRAND